MGKGGEVLRHQAGVTQARERSKHENACHCHRWFGSCGWLRVSVTFDACLRLQCCLRPASSLGTGGIAKHHGKLTMGAFRRKVPRHYIPIHPDNIAKKDWVILLEVGTIVGAPTEKIRVAVATQDKKIVTKYNILLQKK